MIDIHQQLISVLDLYEKCLTVLPIEQAVLNRLLYKFKNAHRRTVYFRKLIHVRKDVQFAKLSDDVEFIKRASDDETFRHDKFFTERLKKTGCNLNETLTLILDCSWHLFQLMKQTFFMTMALAFISILARVFVVFRAILESLSRTLTLLNIVTPWQEPADNHLRVTAGMLSNQCAMIALPSSPERSESESEPSFDPVTHVISQETFSEDLLLTITALEQGCESSEEMACEQTETGLDLIPVNERVANQSELTIPEISTTIVDKAVRDEAETSVAGKISGPASKSRKKQKSKKRRRDYVDEIFDILN